MDAKEHAANVASRNTGGKSDQPRPSPCDEFRPVKVMSATDGLINKLHNAITAYFDAQQALDEYPAFSPKPASLLEQRERAERELHNVNEMASRHVSRLHSVGITPNEAD